MSRKQNNTTTETIVAWILIGIGGISIIYFMFARPFNDGSGVRNPELFGWFGDFIGGVIGSVFTIASIILLIATLKAQREAIKSQNEGMTFQQRALSQERFENTFFNLLQVQQTIRSDIKITYFSLDSSSHAMTEKIRSRDVFRVLLLELGRIDRSVKSVSYSGIYKKDEKPWEQAISDAHETFEPKYEGDNSIETTIKKIRDTTYKQFTNLLYGITSKRWKQAHERTDIYHLQTIYYFLFNRYHYALGHYFRHLYHILKYINQYELKCLDDAKNQREKDEIRKRCKNYSDLVQAQMSAHELALLYYNSLCFPKMAEFVKHYGLLENLTILDLARPGHNLKDEGYNLKKQRINPIV